MIKILPSLLLLGSAAVLFFQLFFFTTMAEQWVGTVAGIAIYAATVFARSRYTITVRAGWAIVAGIILGILPPRLRLGGELDAFVVVYPLIHIVLLTSFVSFYQGQRVKAADGLVRSVRKHPDRPGQGH
jgi:hypothetical protein